MKVGEWGGVPCNPVSIEQPRMLDAVWGGWHTALHWQRGRSGCQWYPCNCWFSWNKKLHPKLWNLCLLPVRNLFNFHKGSRNNYADCRFPYWEIFCKARRAKCRSGAMSESAESARVANTIYHGTSFSNIKINLKKINIKHKNHSQT